MKAKQKSRKEFLKQARKDVEKGMDVGPFQQKYSANKNYDEDDWLMLKNFTVKRTQNGK